MVDVARLRQIMESRQPYWSEYEEMLNAIEFARAELGIYDRDVPATYLDARMVYIELEAKLRPPTWEQRREYKRLLKLTGGKLEGTLISEGQIQVLIEQAKDELDRQTAGLSPRPEDFVTKLKSEWKFLRDSTRLTESEKKENRQLFLNFFFGPMAAGFVLGLIPGVRYVALVLGFLTTVVLFGISIFDKGIVGAFAVSALFFTFFALCATLIVNSL